MKPANRDRRWVLALTAFLGCLLVAVLAALPRRCEPSWRAFERRGDEAFQRHALEVALQYWGETLTQAPDRVVLYNKIAIAHMLAKQPGEAINVLQRGLQMDAGNPRLYYNLSLAHYYCDAAGKALEVLEQVLRLDEDYPDAHLLKGLCLDELGRHDEARQAYVDELNANPGSQKAWQKVRDDS